MTAARAMGFQEQDFAVVFQVLARMSGVSKIDVCSAQAEGPLCALSMRDK